METRSEKFSRIAAWVIVTLFFGAFAYGLTTSDPGVPIANFNHTFSATFDGGADDGGSFHVDVIPAGPDGGIMPFGTGRRVRHRDEVVVLEFAAAGCCCALGDTSATFNSNGFVTNARGRYGSGNGSCVCRQSAGEVHFTLDRELQREFRIPGTTDKVCNTPVNMNNIDHYISCFDNNQCAYHGLGSCVNPNSTMQDSTAIAVSCTAGAVVGRREVIPRK